MSLPETEPRNFDHYVVESVLGRGAMGTVYLAKDVRIGRRVALKTVRVDSYADDKESQDEFFQRLQREAELCGALHHPNIVTLYEVGYESGRVSYLATEYVEGPSLKAVLQNGKLSQLQAFAICEEILIGLCFAHEKKIIHRDLKPGNILLSVRGGAKIADFGIARPEESELTSTGTMMGTPSYMSPEQAKVMSVTPATDLFSLGVLLYEMLSGERPFQAPNMSTVLYNIVHVEPKKLSTVETSIYEDEEQFVHRLLEKKAKDRFANAEEALAELRQIRLRQKERIVVETQPFKPQLPGMEILRRRIRGPVFYGVPAALLLILLLSAFAIHRQTRVPIPPRFSNGQLQEIQQKKVMMANARSLLESGKFNESVAAFDSYLQRYPQAEAARQGRQLALEALERETQITATGPGRNTPGTTPEKPTMRDRVKRIFRRD